jgi:leader peptidase (prepilin peptidase) / N-methyltransferase
MPLPVQFQETAALVPFPVVAFAFGAVWGSFLNVCIHRIPYGLSVVRPASRCPWCFSRIAPWDNIPVLSWLWLRGRCRRCRMGISPRYPLVEAATGAAFAALAARHGLAAPFFYEAAFFALLVALAFIDWEHFILPDGLTLGGAAAGLAGAPFVEGHSLAWAAAGAALGAGMMLAMYWGYRWWRGVEGLGLGDVKLMLMMGAFLGPKGALFSVLYASVGGLLWAAWLAARGRAGWRTALPYGTFLGLGGIVHLFWGAAIEARYWSVSMSLAERLWGG